MGDSLSDELPPLASLADCRTNGVEKGDEQVTGDEEEPNTHTHTTLKTIKLLFEKRGSETQHNTTHTTQDRPNTQLPFN